MGTTLRDTIIGLCRFSFLGRCDWAPTRGNKAKVEDLLEKREAFLFDPRRLQRRFEAFEKLCLPSILHQTDQDFTFLLLTSPELPLEWRHKLTQLCKDVPQIQIITAAERTPCDAFRPYLRAAAQHDGKPAVQFRLDDDDALSIHYIARLRKHARRMRDLPAFAISFPVGISWGSYEGDPVSYWRSFQPFASAGAAVRMRAPGRTIFAFDHFQLPKHFVSVTDHSVLGHMMLRWDEGDSIATIRAKFPPWFKPLPDEEREALIKTDLPFLAGVDLSFARWVGAPRLERTPSDK